AGAMEMAMAMAMERVRGDVSPLRCYGGAAGAETSLFCLPSAPKLKPRHLYWTGRNVNFLLEPSAAGSVQPTGSLCRSRGTWFGTHCDVSAELRSGLAAPRPSKGWKPAEASVGASPGNVHRPKTAGGKQGAARCWQARHKTISVGRHIFAWLC